jgi:alpha-beta hydrolase superfamily lysophospholipase
MSELNIQESSFIGKYDYSIFWRKWLPVNKNVKAIIMLVHGLNEHSGRYINVASEITPEGYPIYAIDHRGHGKSSGKRAYVKRFEDFLDDLRTFYLNIVRKEAEGKPIFILGHSMGSFITMNYVRLYQEGLSGMILSGSGSKTTVSASLQFFAKILSFITPTIAIELPFEEEWITRDKEEIKKYDEDPLCGTKTTFRLGAEINKWIKIGFKNVDQIKIPTLLQRGSADQSFDGIDELFEKIGAEDKSLKIYEGLKHEIYNELIDDRKIVLKDLLNWLNNHI